MKFISAMPWALILIFCLTIGLAPFSPPHIVEKLQMLFRGQLARLIDWLDLLFHGFPWILLLVKIVVTLVKKK